MERYRDFTCHQASALSCFSQGRSFYPSVAKLRPSLTLRTQPDFVDGHRSGRLASLSACGGCPLGLRTPRSITVKPSAYYKQATLDILPKGIVKRALEIFRHGL